MTIAATALRTSFQRQLGDLSRAGQITHATNRVLATLAGFLGSDGLFPAHETLALRVGCSVRTVVRALNRAYDLGIVTRTYQRQWLGGRWVRTSNRYQLIITKAAQMAAAATRLVRRVMGAHRADLSDRVAQNQKKLFSLKERPEPKPPQMTRDEMIAWCLAQAGPDHSLI